MTTRTANRWLLASYAAAIFVSAFLLFQVEPLVSKAILPWFGGTPAVWTTCMLFFQSLLFAGYAYAHFSQRWFSPRNQAVIHLAVILVALCLLKVIPSASWQSENMSDPVVPILLMLTATVGLPFFALSATGPLLQAWYVRSFPGRSPYRLYALSNIGSLLALVSYPFFFERQFDLGQQASFWSTGFGVYATLCGITAISLWMLFHQAESRAPLTIDDQDAACNGIGYPPPANGSSGRLAAMQPKMPAKPVAGGELGAVADPKLWQRAVWLLLPTFASVALLATTNHICADVTVMPLLWIVPLSLYLLTFIIAFDHPRWYRPTLAAGLTLLAIYIVALIYNNGMGAQSIYDCGSVGKGMRLAAETMFGPGGAVSTQTGPTLFSIGFLGNLAWNFAAMFGICMLCHGELVRQRPDPRHLTAFYLMIAAGGALGGVAVSLVAPRVFTTYHEWDLMLQFGSMLALALVGRAAMQAYARRVVAKPVEPHWRAALIYGLPLAIVGVIVLNDLSGFLQHSNGGVQLRARNFFGTLTVLERNVDDPENHYFILQHGRITHGIQFADASRRRQPTSYYSEISGVGQTIKHYRHDGRSGLAIGAVGLGIGTLASYPEKGDSITFYEINPSIVDIAESGKWFTYLPDCKERGAECDVHLGDARLVLDRELADTDAKRFDVLVLDAFSGDAIPAHLLTEEAFQIYLSHLVTAVEEGRDGAIAVHITNRYVDLEPIVRGAAERYGLKMVRIQTKRDDAQAIYPSDWMVLTRNQSLIDELSPSAVAATGPVKPAILWTDARSNLFDALK
jgi:hypothetical protein